MAQTVGILGAGQLGRMIALAGYPLGLRFRFFDPDTTAPSRLLAEHAADSYSDFEALALFAASVDVLTFEFENIPVTAAKLAETMKPIFPSPAALEVSQDRLVEKRFLRASGIPTAEFAPIESEADAMDALAITGLPAVLKTRRMGYDGKGQRVVRTAEELGKACAELGAAGLILESFIPFTAEFSIIAARSISGEIRFYPLVENIHKAGILRTSRAPSSQITVQNQRDAECHASTLMSALNYVGVIAIEFFLVDGELVANEMAPRVHNSGHWTIEGSETSQFENHLRAILDLPLGSTQLRGHAAMLNIIGDLPNISDVLRVPGAHLHLYDKSPRPNRKIGHVTVRANNHTDLDLALERLAFVR
jgi:5-(carboxyamino)imidazole ribonucleotide synthase